jgi:ABC-type histidine transport system ATPase subunit
MRAVVLIEHDGVRGLVAVGIIVESIDHPVDDQLPMPIIAAVIARPASRLMHFDEPTSALDPELVGDVLSVMDSSPPKG